MMERSGSGIAKMKVCREVVREDDLFVHLCIFFDIMDCNDNVLT